MQGYGKGFGGKGGGGKGGSGGKGGGGGKGEYKRLTPAEAIRLREEREARERAAS